MENNKKFDATNLNALIEKTGLTGHQVAEAVGMSFAALRSYLSGKSCPSLEALLKLADFFAVPIDYLVGRCSEETAREIEANYSQTFMELRRGPYEAYLIGRRRLAKINDAVEAPWPYNLLDDMFFKADPWIEVITPDQEKGLYMVLDTLQPREKDCVLSYYKDGMTLREIALRYDVIPERIRQIMAKALRKLRHPSRKKIILYGPEVLELAHAVNEKRRSLMLDQAVLDEWEEELAYKKAYLTEKAPAEAPKKPNREVLNLSIAEMDLSVRSFNCLWHADCDTVGDVVSIIQKGELLSVRNLGKKSAEEILRRVEELTGVRYKI